MSILFAFIASIGQGLFYGLAKKGFEKVSVQTSYLLTSFAGLIIWLPFTLYLGVDFKAVLAVFPIAILSALLAEAFPMFALSKGKLAVTAAIFGTYPLFTTLFSIFINDEKLSLVASIFMAVTVFGLVILNFLDENASLKELKPSVELLIPLAAAVTVGISDSISKFGIVDYSYADFLFALGLAQFPVALTYLLLTKTSFSELSSVVRSPKAYKSTIIGMIALPLTLIFFWLALSGTFTGVASAITATSTITVLIINHFKYKDLISVPELIGILVTLFGTIGLTYVVS